MRIRLWLLALPIFFAGAVHADPGQAVVNDSASGDTAPEIPVWRLHLPPPEVFDPTPRTGEGRTPPPGEEVVNPAEFCRAEAMIVYWVSWHSQELIDMCLAVADDNRVICCVPSSSVAAQAEAMMTAAGVNIANVEFLVTPGGSVWIRDYGPFCIYDDGHLSITDMRYGASGDVDDIPIDIADDCGLPWYRSSLVHHGGNHITDGNGMGFFSTNLTSYNAGWGIEQIRYELKAYLGLDSLVIFPTMQGDATGHCDMWVKLLNDTLFVVGEYENPEDAIGNDYVYLNELAQDLDQMQNLDGRDFEVVRLPMNPILQGIYTINRTYTNSLILNDKVLVPTYDTPLDAEALQIYVDCMPDHEIIGIDSEELIQYLGAIHCISSTLHHSNPVVLLHDPMIRVDPGAAPVLRCRLNPRFSDREVDLHYRSVTAGPQGIIPASFAAGVWSAQMPPVYDDFEYWFVARIFTEAGVLETSLPEGAPGEVFTCLVRDPATVELAAADPSALLCWPKPFTLETTIGFSLLHKERIDLAVYDSTGRLARRLLRGRAMAAGTHRIVWNGRDERGAALPSGVYLIRLGAGSTVDFERAVLLR